MKKIQSFSITSLRVEEDFGFHKLIEAEKDNLPLTDTSTSGSPEEISLLSTPTILDSTVNAYIAAIDAFDLALKSSASNPSTATATAADEARDQSWRGANNYITAMTAHPTPDIAAQAAEAKALFDKYGDPTKLARTEESGILHNLLQDLEGLAAEKRTALAFDAWITDLRSKENAYLAAASQQTEEAAARQVGIVKESRTAADTAYRSLVDTVNALALLNGETDYATFIDHVNAIIDRQKAILKARSTRAKKSEETPSA